jgi:hypothetical protein
MAQRAWSIPQNQYMGTARQYALLVATPYGMGEIVATYPQAQDARGQDLGQLVTVRLLVPYITDEHQKIETIDVLIEVNLATP